MNTNNSAKTAKSKNDTLARYHAAQLDSDFKEEIAKSDARLAEKTKAYQEWRKWVEGTATYEQWRHIIDGDGK